MQTLIVDADEHAGSQLKRFLDSLGYDCNLKTSGKAAWDYLQEDNAPRLVVIDYSLDGDIDAGALAKVIKHDRDRPYTYVFFLDKKENKDHEVKSFDMGGDGYIHKAMQPTLIRSRFTVASRLLHAIPLDDWLKPEIPGYRVNYMLGKGAMGTVWHATQLDIQRDLALKLIRLDLVTAQYRKRFKREIVVAANINHKYIAKIYDSGEVGNIFYYAMELIEGEELQKCAKDFSSLDIVKIMYRVCRGLEESHEHGVIHRDLKPANIMITEGNIPKIVDFGVAKTTLFDDDPVDGWETKEGMAVGTPLYMSPEQAMGKNLELGPASDVYAIGTMLYVLLMNRHPHKLKSYARKDVLESIVTTEPRLPSDLDPDFDKDLEFIIMKALEKDPIMRFANAGDMRYDLEEYLEMMKDRGSGTGTNV